MAAYENWLSLTATITPTAKANKTLRADPEQRMRDYGDALKFYMNLPGRQIDGIFFLENSGADLSALEILACRENPHGLPVKFFSATSDCNPDHGKGHSELQLMDRAFETNFSEKTEKTRIWKITGRLKIENIEKLIATAPSGFSVYIDLRVVPSWLKIFGTDKWADTRIIGFTPKGYLDHFYGKRAIVGTAGPMSHVVELALFPSLYAAWKAGAKIVPRFRIQPVMIGIGAESLKNYNDFSSRVKNGVRRLTRSLAPWLWL